MILEAILDAFLDTLKMVLFLYFSFLILEYIEHSAKEKMAKKLKNGPLYGSLLGAIPQCGFSCMASNLFSSKIISLGTLIAVFISTSDEAFLVLLSSGFSKGNILNILYLVLCKIILGIIIGFIIDLFVKRNDENDFSICDNCGCGENIFFAALKHTWKISLYVFIITALLNIGFGVLGEENLENLLLKGSLFQPFLISLLGLIPNCASSIIITELFINESISFFGCLGGLVGAAGVGYLILFKSNKNIKENLKIVGIMYTISVIIGLFGLI